MKLTVLIVAAVFLCIAAALVLFILILKARSGSVPNNSFRMPDSQARRAAAMDASGDGGRRRLVRVLKFFAVIAIFCALAFSSAYLSITGLISEAYTKISGKDDTLAMEGQLLYAGNEVTITATGLERSVSGWDITISITNSSALNLSFNAHSYAINGIMTGNSMFDMDCSVPAGQTASIALALNSKILSDYDMDAVRCVDIIFWAYNSDSYMKVFDTDQVEIRTGLYDGNHDTLGGTLLYSENGIAARLLEADDEAGCFSISNSSGSYVNLALTDLTINGRSVTALGSDLTSITVLDGCEAKCTIPVANHLALGGTDTALNGISWSMKVKPEDISANQFTAGPVVYEAGNTTPAALPDASDDGYVLIPEAAEPGTGPAGSPVGPFEDTDDSEYYADALVWAYSNGITSGTTETTFSPDENCTRGQIVIFLWRAAGSPGAWAAENPFEDVTDTDACYAAVMWALENGITSGTTETTFAPEETITREQMIIFLWRLAGTPTPAIAATENPFLDVSPDDAGYDAILWAVANGIVSGTDDKTFSPGAEVSRSQAVTFLYRYFG